MGRYSSRLAAPFADVAGVTAGLTAVDVGCGPGALTSVLVDRLGLGSVRACDPSPPFVAECAERFPGIDIRAGRAEAIPFPDDCVDIAVAQLVLHFVSDPTAAAAELCRVVRPGGVVAACVWDFERGMEMLRRFWDAALTVDEAAPDEARVLRYGGPGEIAGLFRDAGLADVRESTLQVATTYRRFDELWSGFLAGIGPAGSYCVALDDGARERVRQELFRRCGSPSGTFSLAAVARVARGTVPL
jgi:ubiquinone/menaquinone biosynthesis C-methylase UbiE